MTLFGFVLGFAIFIGAILHETQEATLFINPHGLLIVFGGSLAAAFAGFHGGELVRSITSLKFIFRKVSEDPRKYVTLFEGLAQKVSQGGLSAIEEEVTALSDGFAKEGLDLLVNGFKRDEIVDIMDTRLETMALAEQSDSNLFRTMATLAPGFGLVGTLIGLIIMLTKLEDVSKVAPSMATAMTATFYGVILANLIFLPLSVKISRRLESKLWLYELIKAGVLMLYEKRHPLYVREKLGAYLEPGMRRKLLAEAAAGRTVAATVRKPAAAKA
ncbi:MAG: MotA/TolQ/ExbB proton channel family protein [Candidatus Sericytochromatia bacterium]|nr:MotA/TolQ/ExbB proton channel family protein [Candidatus Sericytochromatia bacterium]